MFRGFSAVFLCFSRVLLGSRGVKKSLFRPLPNPPKPWKNQRKHRMGERQSIAQKGVRAIDARNSQLEMAQTLQKPVFALPGCHRTSASTLLCDTLGLADRNNQGNSLVKINQGIPKNQGKEGKTPWVDPGCADCPGFPVPAAAGACLPASSIGGAGMTIIFSDNNSRILTAP